MPAKELSRGPDNPRPRALKGLPGVNSEAGNFQIRNGKRYISEKLAASLLSRIAFLEKRLDNRGELFRNEIKTIMRSLFDNKEATAVEYGDRKKLEYLAAAPYVYVNSGEDPEMREMKMDAIANFCLANAESELSFLLEMKRRYFQQVPVSDEEQRILRDMGDVRDYTKRFNTIKN